MSPTTKTMAMQATMSAWFWMTNSWLKMGGFLLEVRRLTAMVEVERRKEWKKNELVASSVG